MTPADEREYRDFVATRLDPLRRTAYLLCRDWHTADDLVAITIGKVYRHWPRVRGADNVDAYVRGVLTHAWLDERRRPWRREEPAAEPSAAAAAGSAEATVPDRLDLLALLARLPRRQRAVVVLRFYCDLPVDETAEILGISAGTVKSQAARGLAALRLLAEPTQGTEGTEEARGAERKNGRTAGTGRLT